MKYTLFLSTLLVSSLALAQASGASGSSAGDELGTPFNSSANSGGTLSPASPTPPTGENPFGATPGTTFGADPLSTTYSTPNTPPNQFLDGTSSGTTSDTDADADAPTDTGSGNGTDTNSGY